MEKKPSFLINVITSKSLRKFSTFFLRSTAFRTLQEGYKRATKRSDPTPPVPPHYSYFGRGMGVFFFLFSHHEKGRNKNRGA